MTPELAWLIGQAAGRTLPPPERLDPDRLMLMLRHHRLLMLLSDRISPHLPTDLADRVRTAHRQQILTGLKRLGISLNVVAAVEAAGIPLVVLKGLGFAAQVYETPLQRGGVDLDLLVAPEQMAATVAVLEGTGYRVVRNAEWKSVDLAGPPGSPTIDLHGHLASLPQVMPLAQLRPFERAVRVGMGSGSLPTLPLPDAIAFAAYHGHRHAWTRLHWLVDILKALDHPAVDWPAVLDRAGELGVARHVLLAAALAAQVFERPLPAALIAPVRHLRGERAVTMLHRSLSDPPSEKGLRASAPLRHLLLELFLHPDWSRRRAQLRFYLSPTPEDQADRGWLYLPRKLLRLWQRQRALRRQP